MSDNVYQFPGNKARPKEPEAADAMPGTPAANTNLHGMLPGSTIVIGDAFTVGMTGDGRLVVLYGTNPGFPEHLRTQVMENRPMHGWEQAILTTLFGLMASQESPRAPQTPVPPEAEEDPYVAWRKNVQWAITQRLILDQTAPEWPEDRKHAPVTYISKRKDLAIAAHGDVFALNPGTDGERAIAFQIIKSQSGNMQLILTFIQRGSIGGMTRTLTAVSKNYNADAYCVEEPHDLTTSQTIAGRTHANGYQEMLDITKFMATGVIADGY